MKIHLLHPYGGTHAAIPFVCWLYRFLSFGITRFDPILSFRKGE